MPAAGTYAPPGERRWGPSWEFCGCPGRTTSLSGGRENKHGATTSKADPRPHGPAAGRLSALFGHYPPCPPSPAHGQTNQAPAHCWGLYLLFPLPERSSPGLPETGTLPSPISQVREWTQRASIPWMWTAVLSQLWCQNNSVSNLSLYSGCRDWFIREPVANLRQPEKHLGPQCTPLGRKVLSLLFELNWEPRSAASPGDLCEESLPGRQASRQSRTERWREMESSDIEPLIMPCLKSTVLLDY